MKNKLGRCSIRMSIYFSTVIVLRYMTVTVNLVFCYFIVFLLLWCFVIKHFISNRMLYNKSIKRNLSYICILNGFVYQSFITFSCSSLAFNLTASNQIMLMSFFLFPQLTVNNVKPMYHYLDVIVTGEIQKEKTDLKF